MDSFRFVVDKIESVRGRARVVSCEKVKQLSLAGTNKPGPGPNYWVKFIREIHLYLQRNMTKSANVFTPH